MHHYENYQGPVDPTPLQPKIGQSYTDNPVLAPIVSDLNQWQYESAITALGNLIRDDQVAEDLSVLARRLLAEVFINLNNYEEAEAVLQEVLLRRPQDVQALSLLAAIHLHHHYMSLAANPYLAILREVDLVIYTRLITVFNLILMNYQRFDLEAALPSERAIDCIALYGHRFEADGSFSQPLLKRLGKTLELAHKFPEARIIVSGGAALSPFLEADRMEEWLVEKGVNPTRIYKDSVAKDTVGNVIGMTQILSDLDSQNCIAITSLTHLPRAWMSLVCQAWVKGLGTKIYAAAPESPNTVNLPEDERLYMVFTILKSAELVEFRNYC